MYGQWIPIGIHQNTSFQVKKIIFLIPIPHPRPNQDSKCIPRFPAMQIYANDIRCVASLKFA